ncbi:MAG: hypothetical protein ACRDKS_02415, partial [Actinomycetota bacterium]
MLPALMSPAAGATRVETVTLLSGPSPFTGDCGLNGSFEPSREGATHIAVNPADPRNIIVAWGQ